MSRNKFPWTNLFDSFKKWQFSLLFKILSFLIWLVFLEGFPSLEKSKTVAEFIIIITHPTCWPFFLCFWFFEYISSKTGPFCHFSKFCHSWNIKWFFELSFEGNNSNLPQDPFFLRSWFFLHPDWVRQQNLYTVITPTLIYELEKPQIGIAKKVPR